MKTTTTAVPSPRARTNDDVRAYAAVHSVFCTGAAGMSMILGCVFMAVVFAMVSRKRTASTVRVYAINLMVAELVDIAASVFESGFLGSKAPVPLDETYCRIFTYFSEAAKYETAVMFLFLALDRMYAFLNHREAHGTQMNRKAAVYCAFVSWVVGGFLAAPATLSAGVHRPHWLLRPSCRSQTAHGVMSTTLSACFVGAIPLVVVAAASTEVLYSQTRDRVWPLVKRVATYHVFSFAIYVLRDAIRAFRSASRYDPRFPDSMDYVEIFSEFLSQMRFMTLPLFILALGYRKPMDEIDMFVDEGFRLAGVVSRCCKSSRGAALWKKLLHVAQGGWARADARSFSSSSPPFSAAWDDVRFGDLPDNNNNGGGVCGGDGGCGSVCGDVCGGGGGGSSDSGDGGDGGGDRGTGDGSARVELEVVLEGGSGDVGQL